MGAKDQFDPTCSGVIPLSKLESFISHLGPPFSRQQIKFDCVEVILAMDINVRKAEVHDEDSDLGKTKLYIVDVYRGVERHAIWRKEEKEKAKTSTAGADASESSPSSAQATMVKSRRKSFFACRPGVQTIPSAQA